MLRKCYLKIRYKLLFLTIIFLIFSSGSIIFFSSSRINLKDNNENSNNIINDKLVRIRTSSNNLPKSYYFDYYKPIIIDHQMVYGSGSHVNFPVLISLLDSDLHDHVNQSNGNDIAFANDTAWLDHEIELFDKNYNDTYAQLIAWVLIPNLPTSVNTTIYIYYGNATMNSRQNPAGVWSSAYQGVWHLSQLSGSVLDSTSYNTLGTVSGTVNRSAVGPIDGAYDFKSIGMINFGDPSCLDMGTNSFTISFWIKFYGGTGGYQLPIYKGSTTEFDAGYDIETNVDASSLGFRISDGGGNLQETNPVDIDYNSWMYLTGVVNRTSNLMSIFKNGLQVGFPRSIAGIGNLNTDNNFYASWNTYYINGLLDEIRISNTSLSTDWIRTEYSNQHDPETFYTLGSEIPIDIIPPTYSNLIESSDPLELGEIEVIKINVSDPSDISQVKIEFEGSNHSMSNIGGDTWQYNSWIPSVVGNYTYMIYMEDNMLNWNSTVGTIEVIDTTPPNYSNLIESSDPLELGQTEVIKINVSDFAGILQVKIEFEGTNHSMTNIGGITWQYNSWTPINWIVYQYTIYMEDNNGNWNSTINNIVVQDTITPSPPILTNSPSGTVSGNLVFDWLDGDDPSGISYYILIIDNETDPSITPGYVFKVNITNTGQASSFYELTDFLAPGKYYYFLAQVDGAGHQSDYTIGTFTYNLNSNNDLTIYIIIGVVLVGLVGAVTVIVTLKKKSQNKMSSTRKKLSIKLILGHIDKLVSSEPTRDKEGVQNLLIQKEQNHSLKGEIVDKTSIKINIDEIKSLGEELFKEGAYLEAIKQFQFAKEILLKQDRHEDTALFSDLITGIESLIEEREKRLDILKKEKVEGDSVKIFELYYDIIKISEKLRDFEAISMFQSELVQYFQNNILKLNKIENYQLDLERDADSYSNDGFFEESAQLYAKCEQISQLLVKLGKKEEITNIEKFRNKKNSILNK
ncbi:MAG: DUF2341 domain-containing protein [Candidatus Odinarchaeota archaeon]